jgi:hypothetical protein
MVDENQVTSDLAKSRKGLIAATLAIVLVLATIVGVAFAMKLGPFAEQSPTVQQPKPESPSKEETGTAEATPTPSFKLPSAEAQEVMYWEQVASAQQVNDLVVNKFASFSLGQIAKNADTADIRVKATYRDGAELNGWLLLRQYNEAWYFAMITRDGNRTTTPVAGAADAAVAKAIAEGNAANQEIPTAILNGQYTTIVVDKVTAGSGTAMIDVTFSGGSAPAAKGQITCISKDEAGVKYWFITGFSKS